jgi:serine phosphatase RsbU (regulator of sigma subunit)
VDHWNRETVEIEVRYALVLHTDKIIDAENITEEFFGLEKLQEALNSQRGSTDEEIRKT